MTDLSIFHYFFLIQKFLQAYLDSIRSDLLESTFQSLRGSDLPYSQLLGTPSMPSRYSSAVSSVNSPTISMSEVSNG